MTAPDEASDPADPQDDPGWRGALASSWTMFVPGLQRRRVAQATRRGDGAIVVLRMLWTSFATALVMIGAVVLVLWRSAGLSEEPGMSTAAALVLVIVTSTVSVGIGAWLERRPLDCSSLAALAASYRTRFFLRIAVAEAAALVSFAAFILSGAAWLYLVGLAVALGQLARIAPTAAHLDADQDRLRWRDCTLRLVDALNLPAPSSDERGQEQTVRRVRSGNPDPGGRSAP